MNIKIYYHNESPRTDFHEAEGAFPDGITADGSQHHLVYDGELGDLEISDSQNDKDILQDLFIYLSDNRPRKFSGDYRQIIIGDIISLDERNYMCRTRDWLKIDFALSKIQIDPEPFDEAGTCIDNFIEELSKILEDDTPLFQEAIRLDDLSREQLNALIGIHGKLVGAIEFHRDNYKRIQARRKKDKILTKTHF